MVLLGAMKGERDRDQSGGKNSSYEKQSVKTWMLVWIHFDLQEKELVAKVLILFI